MIRAFNVWLNEIPTGQLVQQEDGRVSFRFFEEYRQMLRRPVLGQFFEDDLLKTYRGKRNALPAFFANLVPEGQLRELIEHSLGIPEGDDLALLEAVGHDLPGAIEIQASLDTPQSEVGAGNGDVVPELPDAESEDAVLRFSLAGVQMKFSVVREGEKLALAARDRRGEWIVKLDSTRFSHLAENEFATMEWARAGGFTVPECHLQPADSLPQTVRGHAIPNSRVYLIRRYDREADQRIHQEDFAQVVGLPPKHKYNHVTFEQCALLVRYIAGHDEYLEFVRRLVFMVASGNVDAHLKNWSFIYPDAVQAKLSPMYDQVATVAWPDLPLELALKFAGTKNLLKVDDVAFGRLAERAGVDPKETMREVSETLGKIADAWRESAAVEIMAPEHVGALRDYWKRAPLLKRHLATIE